MIFASILETVKGIYTNGVLNIGKTKMQKIHYMVWVELGWRRPSSPVVFRILQLNGFHGNFGNRLRNSYKWRTKKKNSIFQLGRRAAVMNVCSAVSRGRIILSHEGTTSLVFNVSFIFL